MPCGGGFGIARPGSSLGALRQRLNNRLDRPRIAAGRYDYDKTRLMTSGEAALACYCASASSLSKNRSPREHGYPRAIGLWPPGLNFAQQSTASRYPFSASAVSRCRPVTYRTGEIRCFARPAGHNAVGVGVQRIQMIDRITGLRHLRSTAFSAAVSAALSPSNRGRGVIPEGG